MREHRRFNESGRRTIRGLRSLSADRINSRVEAFNTNYARSAICEN